MERELVIPTKHRLQQRVIIDTDAANEVDDQFAIAQAMLSRSLKIEGIVAAHFGNERGSNSMQESRAEIERIVSLAGMTGQFRVENGAASKIPDEHTPQDSPGARLIVQEAMKEDAGRLFIGFLGPLTDMASALLIAPEIAERNVVVIWIGGNPYGDTVVPYSPEFNLRNDIDAANVVFASGIEIWQVPSSIYTMMSVGYNELEEKVGPSGALGRYLVDNVFEWNDANWPYPIEFRGLGDNPAVGLMLNPHCAVMTHREVLRFEPDGSYGSAVPGARLRTVEAIDARFVLEDLFSKLRHHSASHNSSTPS
jgi:purine nucleosidase